MMGRWWAGIDVGGTKIAAGLVDQDDVVRERVRAATPAGDGPDALIGAVASTVDLLRSRLPAGVRLAGVGVGTGGVIDVTRGIVVSADDVLPGWAGTAVASELQRRLGFEVVVDNDVNIAALGELAAGAARGAGTVLFAGVGTGIGGALIIDGRLVRGRHWSAGEIGHLPVPGTDERPCSCGLRGHLEAAAAGPAMVRDYARQGGSAADFQDVVARASAADELARAVISDGARILGRALAGLANVLDPDLIVLGGGVAEAGEPYWAPLRRAFARELLPPLRGLGLVKAELGGDGPLIGAARMAHDRAR